MPLSSVCEVLGDEVDELLSSNIEALPSPEVFIAALFF